MVLLEQYASGMELGLHHARVWNGAGSPPHVSGMELGLYRVCLTTPLTSIIGLNLDHCFCFLELHWVRALLRKERQGHAGNGEGEIQILCMRPCRVLLFVSSGFVP